VEDVDLSKNELDDEAVEAMAADSFANYRLLKNLHFNGNTIVGVVGGTGVRKPTTKAQRQFGGAGSRSQHNL